MMEKSNCDNKPCCRLTVCTYKLVGQFGQYSQAQHSKRKNMEKKGH